MEKKTLTRAQAILHPVRARIIVALSDRIMTPREIADRMDEIPLGTVYRHINTLLSVGILRIVSERRVHGTVERQFALVEEASFVNREEIGAEDLMGLVTALTGILQGSFGRYLRQASFPLPDGAVSLVVKSLYLTREETQEMRSFVVDQMKKTGRQPTEGMERRLIGFFSVPDVDTSHSPTEPTE